MNDWISVCKNRARQWIDFERRRTSDTASYQEYHQRRYDFVVALCARLESRRPAAVLDVGRSPLSLRLQEEFGSVSTLGFAPESDSGGHVAAQTNSLPHITFDLNQAADPDRWPAAGPFDLVVIAEVIEHLVAAPELVLSCLATFCKPGAFIVCQTPNAVAFHKRLVMLAGRNPYERIRCDSRNPGHFRESSKRELVLFGSMAGLECVEHRYAEYFGISGGFVRRVLGGFGMSIIGAVPSFRRGQTIVYRRPL